MKKKIEDKKEQWKERLHSWGVRATGKPVRHFIGNALLLNILIEICNQRTLGRLFTYVFGNPLVFLYNTLLLMVPLSFSFLFKRRGFFYALLWAACAVLGIINGIVLSCRVTPFNATDFKLARFGFSLMTQYLDLWMIILVAVGIVVLIAALVVMWRKLPMRELPLKRYKLFAVWAVFVFFVCLVTQVTRISGLISAQFPNLQEAYREYGMPYCFTCSIFHTGIERPDDYDEDTVEDIADNMEEEESQPEDLLEDLQDEVLGDEPEQLPNIIFVQLESYFDITAMKDLTFSEDPIPVMRSLMKEYSSGYVSVPSIGAGTANTEFEMITGMNLDFFGPGEYPYKTILQKTTCESMAYIMREYDYTAHAMHNNTGSFYDRHRVFSQLGFDTFTSIEYMEHMEYTETGWAKDEGLIPQIQYALDSTAGSDYIYTISVQGHGKYPEEEILTEPKITVAGLETEEEIHAYTYYVNQLHEMDQFVGKLIRELEKNREEEYVVVFYGDHLPTLGIEEEDLEGTTLFQTPYVIWTTMDMERETRNLEAYQMSAWVLEQLDMGIGIMPRFHQTYFDADMTAAAEETEDFEEEDMDGDGLITVQDTYLSHMEMLEYDLLYGDGVILVDRSPFEATDLQMGVLPINIYRVSATAGGRLFVGGENFTAASVIYDGEEPLETEFLSQWLLTADIPEKEAGDKLQISVVQYAKGDRVELSRTEQLEAIVREKEQAHEIGSDQADPDYQQSEETETTETETTEAETAEESTNE